MDILALLFPREKKFYRMIEEQVALVGEASGDFHKLITQFDKLTPAGRQKLVEAIGDKEKRDDELYTQMVRALKSTFITPMDREDIHQLVGTFDDIIDTLELITLKLAAFDIQTINKYFIKQTEIFFAAYKLVEKTILAIRSEGQVEKLCLKIRGLETDADKVFIKALTELFHDSTDPVLMIKLKDLHASMENMVDRLNDVSLIIENLAVKYS